MGASECSSTRDCIIYGLVDPRTKEIRYVGLSKCGTARADQHRQPSRLRKDKTHKGNWIRQLEREGLTYEIVILEDFVDSLWDSERWWIEFGVASGWPLTNHTNGGETGPDGYLFTEEHRKKISAALSGRKKGPISTEHARALKRSRLGKRNSKDHRNRISKSLRGHTVSEEARDKIRSKLGKPVKDLETGLVYSSVKAAAEELGLREECIIRVAKGRYKRTGGKRFEYA